MTLNQKQKTPEAKTLLGKIFFKKIGHNFLNFEPVSEVKKGVFLGGKGGGLMIQTLLYCIQARKCSNPMRSCPTPNSEMTLWSHHWFGRLFGCKVPSIFMALWNSDRTMWVPDSFEYNVHKNLNAQNKKKIPFKKLLGEQGPISSFFL